ncbi:hypothetical protein [Elizabethkingia anophelis]|uniref:hypothetical protein n=1 Tax=Elizabethkingia anophelis TaxID=1117645 RepID=UPI001318ECBB|nr:hypothetical protein [Elizabethkingia anophelis]MBE9392242.1 hypothetical protein [Elizabethkingia anophelis]MBE9406820.1 hypothetical protein [Elizabethkingia anophelis]BBQ06097.1 hypothetical protein JUNP353_0668 [Elizabethkingia anophelis]
MNKKVPHRISYNTTSVISEIQFWFIISGTILSFVTMFSIDNKLNTSLEIVICIISILYFISEILFSNFFTIAEQQRLDDLIDNSLSSKIADNNSENYYTNDDLKQNVTKLGVNGFENAFFTKNISRKMYSKKLPIFLIVIVVYLISIFIMEKSILVKFFQLLLPLFIIKEFVQLCLFRSRVEKIFNCYKQIFSSIKKSDREPIIIHNIIAYEKLLSTYNIQLDSKIFNKMNEKLSKEWIQLKEKYNI